MSDYQHAKSTTNPAPYWPIEVYQDWLRRGLGNHEQQKRYRAAVEWLAANTAKKEPPAKISVS